MGFRFWVPGAHVGATCMALIAASQKFEQQTTQSTELGHKWEE